MVVLHVTSTFFDPAVHCQRRISIFFTIGILVMLFNINFGVCQFKKSVLSPHPGYYVMSLRYWYISDNGVEWRLHNNDVIMGTMASQITSLTIVYSTVYSGADQRTHQSSASLAYSPHKWPVTRKCFHLITSSCDFRQPVVSTTYGDL